MKSEREVGRGGGGARLRILHCGTAELLPSRSASQLKDAHRQRGAHRDGGGGGRLHPHQRRRLPTASAAPHRATCPPPRSTPPSPTAFPTAARAAHLKPVQEEAGGQRRARPGGPRWRRRWGGGRGAAPTASAAAAGDGVPGAAVPVGAPEEELRQRDFGVSRAELNT